MRTRMVLFLLLALGTGYAAGRFLPGGPQTDGDAALQRGETEPGTPGSRGDSRDPGEGNAPESTRDQGATDPVLTASASMTTAALPAPAAAPGSLRSDEQSDIDVFRRASVSVVHVTSREYQRDFFFDVLRMREGTGSGIIWDKSGHVVTNFHVVQNASEFRVKLSDQSTFEATVIGAAPEKDIAMLKVSAPASKLVPLERGRSRDLQVGQKVLAVGNPFGLDQSLTVGVLSALGRELESPNGRTIFDVIQTDAPINPGNSGGPLLDSRGRMIGVNSAIYSPSGAYAGVGFAIPVDTVARLAGQLITHGRAIQPGIGVTVLSDAIAVRAGLSGVLVRSVRNGSPADLAGLKGIELDRFGMVERFGDRIVAVDGKKIESTDDLYRAFEEAGVGATVTLSLARDGQVRDIKLTLAAVT